MHTSKKALTLYDGGPCRIKTSPLIYSANQSTGFYMIVALHQSYSKSLFLQVVKQNSIFFSTWVFFHEYLRFTGQQGKGEAISIYPFYHSHSLHRHLDIKRVITAESSPLRE